MPVKYHRKVIKIKAVDSPNVRCALLEQRAGLPVSDTILLPGVLTWEEYCHRRATWDVVRQCVGLDAEFWMGAALLLFPPDWLNHAEQLANELLLARRLRIAKSIGIDPAEGGDKTSMCAIDEFGIIELVSRKTPNTNDVPREAKMFMRKHNVSPENVVFDRGGGGKQHADRLRAEGFPVRTIPFGESLVLEPKRGKRQFNERTENIEERYAYVNRRAEMFWELSQLTDPTRLIEASGIEGVGTQGMVERRDNNGKAHYGAASTQANSTNRLQHLLLKLTGFSIPASFREVVCEKHGTGCLRAQLAVMPKLYDKEGRCRMLAKNPPPGKEQRRDTNREKCLIELIGHSPDEADSLVLAVHGMLHKASRATAGVAS